ncbi:hypothetical protein MPSEU_000913300 [Mayamaea pseudoterrestris]|nr:hypothetical protein MPSEU_000913300 [Mayamaea pseudoterrestris]
MKLLHWLLFAVLIVSLPVAISFESCSVENGGGSCPTGNTCCAALAGDSAADATTTTSFCIPNDLGSYNATCCRDDERTGCAYGYQCIENYLCLAETLIMDPLVQVLPRYKLCQGQAQALYGLPAGNDDKNEDAKFVYYSSHGDLRKLHQTDAVARVQMILIVIHRAGRNADDYFCASTAAIKQQSHFDPENVLLVAPRFPNMDDDELEIIDNGTAIRWSNEADGAWRYGEAAMYPLELQSDSFSSFQAIDLLIQTVNTSNYTSLQRVAIVGHSSGGQFVQRWALMTSSWNDSLFHGVVANPSSYAYLTPLRWIGGEWMQPFVKTCPEYNDWGHGLYMGVGNDTVSYVAKVLQTLGTDHLLQRLRSRNMVYLAGSLDVCNVPGHDAGWCDSHGLETTCSDMMQGRTRLERHERYVRSMELLGIPYHRSIVPGVPHDHSLMFNSNEGLRAIFGPESFDVSSTKRGTEEEVARSAA